MDDTAYEKDRAKELMGRGVLFMALHLLIDGAQWIFDRAPQSTHVLKWAALLYGLFEFLRGFDRWLQARHTEPSRRSVPGPVWRRAVILIWALGLSIAVSALLFDR